MTPLNFKREACQNKKKVSEWINSIAPSPFDNYSERVTKIPGSFACLLIRTLLNYAENGHLSVFPSRKMSYIVNPAVWTLVTVTHCLFPCHNHELIAHNKPCSNYNYRFCFGLGGWVWRLYDCITKKTKTKEKRKIAWQVWFCNSFF